MPEYVGLHVRMDMLNPVRVAAVIRDGDAERYEPLTVDIESHPEFVLVEPLSDASVRIAFRTRTDDHLGDTAGGGVWVFGRNRDVL